MTQQAELYKKIDKLPPKYVGRIIDFVGRMEREAQYETKAVTPKAGNNGKYLLTKTELDEMIKNSPTLPLLSGILSELGDVDLDEIRMARLAKHL